MKKLITAPPTALLLLALTAGLCLAQAQAPGKATPSGTEKGGTAATRQMDLTAGTLISADRLDGRRVLGTGGKEIGEVESILLNPRTGRLEMVVLGRGGFLNIGENLFAVPWEAFTLTDKGLTTSITEEQLAKAPTFNEREIQSFSQPANLQRVYSYYGYTYTPETGMGGTPDRPATTPAAPDQPIRVPDVGTKNQR